MRVPPTREAVTIAAATLGRRTMNVAELDALLSGKLVSALRSVASEMTMEEMHERRGEYVTRVKESALEGLKQNGLELESVAITDLDQTDLEFFNPSNRFDAEGLTKLIEDIEARRKLRNDIEQESMILIRSRNLEAEKQALDIDRESETARLNQERDIEVRRAVQRAELARERSLRDTEAEQAQIAGREEVEKTRIAHERALAEARIISERDIREREIERGRQIDEAEIAARERVERARIAQERVLTEARIAREEDDQRREIERQRNVEQAEITRARGNRESADRARARRRRRPHRQGGREPAARDRAHPQSGASRDRRAGSDRTRAHRAGARGHRRAYRAGRGNPSPRDHAQPRHRRRRDRRRKGDRSRPHRSAKKRSPPIASRRRWRRGRWKSSAPAPWKKATSRHAK